jgi:hypothetical protein
VRGGIGSNENEGCVKVSASQNNLSASVEVAARDVAQDLDLLTEQVVAAIVDRVPDYDVVVERAELTAATRRDLALYLRVLSTGQLEENDATLALVSDRARQGVSLDVILVVFSIGEQLAWNRLLEACHLRAVPAGLLFSLQELRFRSWERFIRTAAAAHRAAELSVDREAQARRAGMLQRVLLGEDEAPRQSRLAALGLEHRSDLYVVIARGCPAPAEGLERALSGGRHIPPHGVAALVGEEVLAVLTAPPVDGPRWVAGWAGPVEADALPAAYASARRAFDTATAWGRRGTVAFDDLPLQAAVLGDPDVTAALRRRYADAPKNGPAVPRDVLQTVKAFLRSGQRRNVAAARLHVHPNTVTYRVSRFTETTGADLTDLGVLAELWWLFAAEDAATEHRAADHDVGLSP